MYDNLLMLYLALLDLRDTLLNTGMGQFILVLLLALYFAPAITAFFRYHRNRASILVINLFLGWTFIGWVVALAMSVTNNVEARPVVDTKKTGLLRRARNEYERVEDL